VFDKVGRGVQVKSGVAVKTGIAELVLVGPGFVRLVVGAIVSTAEAQPDPIKNSRINPPIRLAWLLRWEFSISPP
jgi:hypothetical protein